MLTQRWILNNPRFFRANRMSSRCQIRCVLRKEREREGDAEEQVESAEANFSSGGCRRERDWVQIKGCSCCVDEQRSQVLSLTATFSLGVHKWL